MQKVSVIIPTIQKNLKVLEKLVGLLESDNAVSEILIINNKVGKKINFKTSKLKVYDSKENLYVNASWNLGIEMIKNDIFLIINDDILCCKNYCTKVLESEILDKENTGLLGISNQFINQKNRLHTTDLAFPSIDDNMTPYMIPLRKILGTGDWGSAIFGKKENYYKIPDELKIIYGDNYLLQKNVQAGKMNYEVSWLPFNHIHSLSSADPEFSAVINADCKNYVKYIDERAAIAYSNQ